MEVKHPYYLCKCLECGYTESSETFFENKGPDDADVVCPKCFSVDNEEPDEDE